MTHDELVALVRGGVTEKGGLWADFGAGTGAFTRALRELLGGEALIYAIDRDQGALAAHQDPKVQPVAADFTQRLDLPPLNGILMANALHFVRDQEYVMQRIAGYLRPGGRLILVEYARRYPWTPYPVTFEQFAALAAGAGLVNAARIGSRRSRFSGIAMYAALARRPA